MVQQQRRFCVRCKTEIPAERVEAVPDTRLCVDCSRAVGSEFVVTFSTENLGKAGSLKKNYGGVEQIVKRRKRIEPVD